LGERFYVGISASPLCPEGNIHYVILLASYLTILDHLVCALLLSLLPQSTCYRRLLRAQQDSSCCPLTHSYTQVAQSQVSSTFSGSRREDLQSSKDILYVHQMMRGQRWKDVLRESVTAVVREDIQQLDAQHFRNARSAIVLSIALIDVNIDSPKTYLFVRQRTWISESHWESQQQVWLSPWMSELDQMPRQQELSSWINKLDWTFQHQAWPRMRDMRPPILQWYDHTPRVLEGAEDSHNQIRGLLSSH
jgi:hypothetical protein